MSTPPPASPAEAPARRVPWEALLLLSAALALALFAPRWKGLGIGAPVAWLLAERVARRSRAPALAFRGRTFPADLRGQLGLVLLVGVVLQAAALLGARELLPAFVAHVVGRLPLDLSASWPAVLAAVLAATLGEELVFRGFFQARLAGAFGLPAAIGATSAVFSLMHFTPGPPVVVALDLALIAADSVLYGVVFARSHSLLVAWTAHALADLVGLGLLLALR